ncbi:hypothetical protein JRO89_XSUnG0141700 [Xanthoceras sorbifolium]|uniref:DUF538 domain-containing protein n=1 Tax=Xanthoceras sorbifolium TaxID=99658 RepID=A0ABQ8GY21_9ROSI|nr:hypothetical protein JRO89_XSUnG0141700 [Xanthoceras sorbifolium]
MDQVMNKVGSFWLGRKANKEMSSVGDDINVSFSLSLVLCFKSLGTSIEGGAKWLVNKIKGKGLWPNVIFYHKAYTGLSFEVIYPVSTGKMQKPLQELLKEYDLPIGIFPKDATNYEFNEETKKLTVFVPEICEVGYKDHSVLRFNTTITGYLEKGKFAEIEGMKTKVMIWVKVSSITSEGAKLHFMAGLKKTRNREVYEVLRDGVCADKF